MCIDLVLVVIQIVPEVVKFAQCSYQLKSKTRDVNACILGEDDFSAVECTVKNERTKNIENHPSTAIKVENQSLV